MQRAHNTAYVLLDFGFVKCNLCILLDIVYPIQVLERIIFHDVSAELACVACVSVAFSELLSRFPNFGCAGNGARAEQMRGGRGGGKKKRLPANPMILQNALFTLEHTSVACLSKRWPMRRKDMSTEIK